MLRLIIIGSFLIISSQVQASDYGSAQNYLGFLILCIIAAGVIATKKAAVKNDQDNSSSAKGRFLEYFFLGILFSFITLFSVIILFEFII